MNRRKKISTQDHGSVQLKMQNGELHNKVFQKEMISFFVFSPATSRTKQIILFHF